MIETRFEQDLKLLTRDELTKKYGDHPWDEYYKPGWQKYWKPLGEPRGAVTFESVDEGMEVFVAEEVEPSAPPYKGRAFGKFVMIRRLESEHSGRLVMPERISGTSDVGWVASVGEDVKYIKKGDVVAFDQFCSVGREFRLIDENGLPGTFLMAEESDIMAVLEKVIQQKTEGPGKSNQSEALS